MFVSLLFNVQFKTIDFHMERGILIETYKNKQTDF